MANASTFSKREWELIKNAPSWVYAAVSAADTRQEKATLRNVKELKGYQAAVQTYESRCELVQAIIANTVDIPTNIKKTRLDDAIRNLAKINDLLKKKVGRAEGEDVRDFLVAIGQTTAEAASEKVLGIGEKVSEKEAAVLDKVRNALGATSEHKRARMEADLAQQKEKARDNNQ
ncbi:MAG: hypothetical protein QNJ45_05145 [Ardenticatenaceae bacterium]|nr:hypothetical protein [Ardenticatenaceae bacterium]